MKKRLTISDIARLAGVGTTTVSRVLNQDPKVKPETRHKIEQIIVEAGYAPSPSARAMRTQRQQVVGVIVSRLDSASEHQAVRGILQLLEQGGYEVLLMESGFSSNKVAEHLNWLRLRQADGAILFAFTGLELDGQADWQDKLVVMARRYPGFSSVCYDDKGAIALMLEHLWRQGVHRPAYVGVELRDSTTGQQRLEAYLAFCRERGISPHYRLGGLSHQAGMEAAHLLLTEQVDTDALVCASDTLALGAAKHLQQSGKTLTLTGIGNNELLRFLFPNVASVDLGYQQAGIAAARQLLAQIEQRQGIAELAMPCRLVSAD
ncbi:trehalose operon repressor [Zobellella endophytica]|uniref:Trehalose operon repressor n=1 Tax=Zobellella endophytica TaxID=2116700 RepID=A0A2P7R993_9GAMM|nr:trehalose operon repressor TreR [Zobellella endophytica]PSJ46769.1 trehalose operon repressor [Zobellella endophytica]